MRKLSFVLVIVGFLFLMSFVSAGCSELSSGIGIYECSPNSCLNNLFCNSYASLCVGEIGEETSFEFEAFRPDGSLVYSEFNELNRNRVWDISCPRDPNSTAYVDITYSLKIISFGNEKIQFKIKDFDEDDFWKRNKKELEEFEKGWIDGTGQVNDLCLYDEGCSKGLFCKDYQCAKMNLFQRFFHWVGKIF